MRKIRNNPEAGMGKIVRAVPKEKLVPAELLPKETVLRHWLTLQTIAPDSPAAQAGLEPEDEIISINGQIGPVHEFIKVLQESNGALQIIKINRSGKEMDIPVQPRWNPETQMWTVGFTAVEFQTIKYAWSDGGGEEERTLSIGHMPLLYRFASGKTVEGRLELDAEPGAGEAGHWRIKKFIIFVQPDTGEPYEYDLLERFNRTGTAVHLDRTIDSGGLYYGHSNTAKIKNVAGPETVQVVLHELRHAEQLWSDQMQRLKGHYLSTVKYSREEREKVLNRPIESEYDIYDIEYILRVAFPEMDPSEQLKPLREWLLRYQAEAKKKRPNQDRLTQLQNEGSALKIIGSATVRDIRALPTMLIERDAGYGGLIGMRTLKKETGIDFTEPFYLLGEQISEEEFQSLMAVVTDSDLKDATLEMVNRPLDSFQSIRHYMEKLGLSSTCLRDMRKASRMKSKPQSEDLREVA